MSESQPHIGEFIPYSASKELFIEALEKSEIKFWEDPGHGWLQVPLPLLEQLKEDHGLKISSYSYRDSNYGYLEEDCDLTAFINCLPEFEWKTLFRSGQIENKYSEYIFIRRLSNYK